MRIWPPIAVVRPLSQEPHVWAFDEECYHQPDLATAVVKIEDTEQIESLVAQLCQTNRLLDQMTETATDLNGLLCGLRACYGLPVDTLARWRAVRRRLESISSTRRGLYDWVNVGKEGGAK